MVLLALALEVRVVAGDLVVTDERGVEGKGQERVVLTYIVEVMYHDCLISCSSDGIIAHVV